MSSLVSGHLGNSTLRWEKEANLWFVLCLGVQGRKVLGEPLLFCFIPQQTVTVRKHPVISFPASKQLALSPHSPHLICPSFPFCLSRFTLPLSFSSGHTDLACPRILQAHSPLRAFLLVAVSPRCVLPPGWQGVGLQPFVQTQLLSSTQPGPSPTPSSPSPHSWFFPALFWFSFSS